MDANSFTAPQNCGDESDIDPPVLSDQKIKEFMLLALDEAKNALKRSEVPVGCVIVKGEEVLAAASNRGNELLNGIKHAEIEAIGQLIAQFGPKSTFEECTAFTTCEPCIMCSGALSLIRCE